MTATETPDTAPRVGTGNGGLAAVVAAAALWGLGGTVAGRLFAGGADPLEVVAVRTWIAAAGLALLLPWRRRAWRKAGPRVASGAVRAGWRPTIGFGIAVAVANAGLFLAIARLPVAVALVLQNLAPALVVAWTAMAARRVPPARVVIGLAAALAGVGLVVELPTAPLSDLDLVGVLFALLTAAAVAAFSGLGGAAARGRGALAATTWAFAISGVLWLAVQLARGVPDLFHRPGALLAAAGVGLFGTLLPFLLFSWGAARVGAAIGAVNISLEPIFGAALAWAWLGQELTPVQLAGALVLLIALLDVQRSARRSGRTS
ncbi:EamA family transporter [Spirillospora albida]|uniref:EamA family transporter n=1 Tax=Spirillospora albida TaxID=58123 RepID=UPI0004C0217D|nr:EamA family transporter [Spirillospora albida]